MHHLPPSGPGRRGLIGETLIVITVIVGCFMAFLQDKLAPGDIWMLLGFLAIIVVFYAALLLCRMMFFHATGGEVPYPWWALREDMEKHMKGQKK